MLVQGVWIGATTSGQRMVASAAVASSHTVVMSAWGVVGSNALLHAANRYDSGGYRGREQGSFPAFFAPKAYHTAPACGVQGKTLVLGGASYAPHDQSEGAAEKPLADGSADIRSAW